MDLLTSHQYLVLVGADGRQPGEDAHRANTCSGMHAPEGFVSDRVRLFVSTGTPAFPVQGGGMVIGHLFRRDGTLLRDGSLFSGLSGPTQVRRHILEHCWGDYLLLQQEEGNGHSFRVTRDPSGGLPCVYSFDRGAGFVTSNIALVAALGFWTPRISWDFIAHSLAYTHLKTRRTGFSGVCELLPGFSLLARGSKVAVEQEWCPWKFVAPEHRHTDPRDAASEVRSTVDRVVGAMAEADRTLLLELSGGLDSSIIAASLRGTTARTACCTLVTPVPGADEREYASAMTNVLGVDLVAETLRIEDAHFHFAPPPNSVAPRIWALQYAVNTVMEAHGDAHRVASYYSGGGGDSVFAYIRSAAPAADAFRERGLSAGLSVVRDLSELHHCTFWKAGKLTVRKLSRPPKPPCKPDASFLSPAAGSPAAERHPWFAAPSEALPGDRERIFGLAGTQVFRDGIARAAKRRYRMPLLSQPVMEACLRVPTWMWFAGGRNRAVARDAFHDILPPKVLHRRSKGTFTGYSGAVYLRNKHRMQAFLLDGELEARGMLDRRAVRHFFESTLTRDKALMRIFDLCMIENWVRHRA